MKSFNKIKIALIVLFLGASQFIIAQEGTTFSPKKVIEGRVMYDFEFLNAGDSLDYQGQEFRRVRFAAKGMVAKNIGYKVEFDLAGGAVNYRDVYLNFMLPGKAGHVLAGSFTEPTSLNNMTSSKYITFFSRSMMASTQPFKYNSGFMYDNQKLADGRIGIQTAITFNGDKHSGFIDKDIQYGNSFTGRLTGVVMQNKEKNQVVHLGVNYEQRANDNGAYHYKFHYENHMGGKTEVGVDTLFNHTSDLGFELATTFGPLSIQGEYEMGSIITEDKTFSTNGYYAFVSYFITGEHRPYKHGSFGRVKPKNDFCLVDHTWGALELVARYSVMDLGGAPAYDGVSGTNAIANITAGLNWYLNPHTRIMYNYTTTNFNDLKVYGDEKLVGNLIRLQVDF